MAEASQKLKVYAETTFFSNLTGRLTTNRLVTSWRTRKMSDPVVEEVRSARRARFSSFGNDLDRYCAKLRESAEKAKSMGISFVEYCRNFSALETAAV